MKLVDIKSQVGGELVDGLDDKCFKMFKTKLKCLSGSSIILTMHLLVQLINSFHSTVIFSSMSLAYLSMSHTQASSKTVELKLEKNHCHH